MALIMNKQQFEALCAYAEKAYPHECCGFLLGAQENSAKKVAWLFPAFNEREETEKYHRFLITPEAYMRCEKYARENQVDIIGFYHSHPNVEAKPSEYDLQHAWPWYSYVIVAVKEQHARNMTSWILQDDRKKFRKEDIVVES